MAIRIRIRDAAHAAELLREAIPEVTDVYASWLHVTARVGPLHISWTLDDKNGYLATHTLYAGTESWTVWSSHQRPNKNTLRAIRTALKQTETRLAKQLREVQDAQAALSATYRS